MDVAWIQAWLFQHTAARRRLLDDCETYINALTVSTHSRPKAADALRDEFDKFKAVSTHSRPKAAGINLEHMNFLFPDCFNTQPPEGGCQAATTVKPLTEVSTHSRPKAAA